MNAPKKILVRTPNWLGDLVMSLGFLHKLPEVFPEARIEAIAKAEIADLLELVPAISQIHRFSKQTYRGVRGLYRFASGFHDVDVYFSLPDSFSAALMGVFSRAKRRVGFCANQRRALLTDALRKPTNKHRSEEYAHLLSPFVSKPIEPLCVKLVPPSDTLLTEFALKPKIALNLNSESPLKVVPIEKGVEIATELLRQLPEAVLVLTGSPKEQTYTEKFCQQLPEPKRVVNLAGRTSVKTLAGVLAAVSLVISTDSGTAHLANAVGTPTVVLYGAGNERNTAPYHQEGAVGVRVQGLPCAPCISTTCKFGVPKCLALMPAAEIVEKAVSLIRYTTRI
ncbi:MAG: glycosyltransferase family 9 protein [Chloroherpetonaceae bacterium]|nr:glycosyltransferase family 9 protein [Chloroherpetonaceae bacterium]